MSLKIIDNELDFDDVLIQQKRSFALSRKDIDVERDFQFYHSTRKWFGCPIVCSPMPYLANINIGLIMSDHKMITCLHKFHTFDELVDIFSSHQDKIDYLWCTTGITEQDYDKINGLYGYLDNKGLKTPNLCIDAANAGSDYFIKQCAEYRKLVGDVIIMAGNTTEPDITTEIIMYGLADIVKVGIGPSKLCATRRVTGVGRSQLSAILSCSSAAHGLKNGPKRLGLTCADGGIKEIGDMCKAFGGGADMIMCAGFFNGVQECSGEWKTLTTGEKICLKVYGLSSYEAQEKHFGGFKPYRASEGESFWVEEKGPIQDLLMEIKGGLRSLGSYINAPSIRDFSKCTTFYKVNRLK